MPDEGDSTDGIGPDHPFLIAGKWAADELAAAMSAVRIGATVVLTVSTALIGFHLSDAPLAGIESAADTAFLAAVGAIYVLVVGYGGSALSLHGWNIRPDSRALEERSLRHPEAVVRTWVAAERAAALRSNESTFAVHLRKLAAAVAFTAVLAVLVVVAAIAA